MRRDDNKLSYRDSDTTRRGDWTAGNPLTGSAWSVLRASPRLVKLYDFHRPTPGRIPIVLE